MRDDSSQSCLAGYNHDALKDDLPWYESVLADTLTSFATMLNAGECFPQMSGNPVISPLAESSSDGCSMKFKISFLRLRDFI